MDSPLWAGVDAAAAEYALGVFHPPLLDHILHIQPHGAGRGAPTAAGAPVPISEEAERRPPEEIPYLPADDHDHCDRAEVMTEATSSSGYGEYGDKGDLGIEYGVCSLFRDRDAMIGVIKWVDGCKPSGGVDCKDEGGKEQKEYQIFEPVQPAVVGPSIINLNIDLL